MYSEQETNFYVVPYFKKKIAYSKLLETDSIVFPDLQLTASLWSCNFSLVPQLNELKKYQRLYEKQWQEEAELLVAQISTLISSPHNTGKKFYQSPQTSLWTTFYFWSFSWALQYFKEHTNTTQITITEKKMWRNSHLTIKTTSLLFSFCI